MLLWLRVEPAPGPKSFSHYVNFILNPSPVRGCVVAVLRTPVNPVLWVRIWVCPTSGR